MHYTEMKKISTIQKKYKCRREDMMFDEELVKTIMRIVMVSMVLGMYYYLKTSKYTSGKRIAIIYRLTLLGISFIFTLFKIEIIRLEQLVFSEYSVVLYLAGFELVDEIIELKSMKRRSKKKTRKES